MKNLLLIPIFVTSYLRNFVSVAYAQAPGEVDIESKVTGFFGFTCIQHLVFRIVDVGILVSGLLLLIYLVWGGVEWLTSGGDKGKVENARSKITNAIVGVAIIASAFAIWKVALTFFGVDLTNICTKDPISS